MAPRHCESVLILEQSADSQLVIWVRTEDNGHGVLKVLDFIICYTIFAIKLKQPGT